MNENEGAQIDYLADHAAAIPALAGWFEAEWPGYYGASGPGDARSDLQAYANRDGLPVGFVALCAGELCGFAALKGDSILSLPHLTPWVAAGLVLPRHRGRGIGAALIRFLEAVAKTLGYSRIYCGTTSAHSLLSRRGWRFQGAVSQDDEAVSVYEKIL